MGEPSGSLARARWPGYHEDVHHPGRSAATRWKGVRRSLSEQPRADLSMPDRTRLPIAEACDGVA